MTVQHFSFPRFSFSANKCQTYRCDPRLSFEKDTLVSTLAFETHALPTFPRCYPHSFTFYVANPIAPFYFLISSWCLDTTPFSCSASTAHPLNFFLECLGRG